MLLKSLSPTPTFAELHQHATALDMANNSFPYAQDRKTCFFDLTAEIRVRHFQFILCEALNNARKHGRPLPVVVVKHVARDFPESVNGDSLLGFLEPNAFEYAILTEFTKQRGSRSRRRYRRSNNRMTEKQF